MTAYPEQDQPERPSEPGVYLWPLGDFEAGPELADWHAGGPGPDGRPPNGMGSQERQQPGAGGWARDDITVNGWPAADPGTPGGWQYSGPAVAAVQRADSAGTGWPDQEPGSSDWQQAESPPPAWQEAEPSPASWQQTEPPLTGWQQPGSRRPGGDDRAWAILAYMSAAIFGFAPPLLVYVLKRRGSLSLSRHIAQAANTALTMALYLICVLITGGLLVLDSRIVALAIAGPLAVLLWLVTVGYLVRAAVAASREEFRAVPSWLCATIVPERQPRTDT